MRRVSLLFAMISMFMCSIYATDSIPTPKSRYGFYDAELSGNIDKIDYMNFSYSIDKQTNQIYKTYAYMHCYVFNKRGDVAKTTVMHDDIVYSYKYKYTRDGLISRDIRYQAGIGASIKSLYNKSNQLVKVRWHAPGSSNMITRYFYDSKGNLQEVRWSRDETDIYIYDEKGNIIELCSYNSDNELCAKNTYAIAYNEQGNIVEERTYDINNRLIHQKIYNQIGNLTDSSSYNSDGKLVDKTTYSYDQKGVLIEKYKYTYSLNKEKEEIIKYSYDDKGNKVKESYYDLTGYQRGATEYEYDTFNNIIFKKKTYEEVTGHCDVEIWCYDITYKK